MAEGTFATAINCMDGRVQSPVADWVKIDQHVQFVDIITEAGADGVMVRGTPVQLDSIKQHVLISVKAHNSSFVAIAGHQGCAGNPVSEPEHIADIRAAMAVVVSWQLPVKVVGLWVNEWGYVDVVGRLG
ncbi:MAG: carbonic anhydrase [Ktedonobacterales bacterium]